LGNIKVEDGSIITPKSIVTKPVPPLAIVSGIPAKIKSYIEVDSDTEAAQIEEIGSIIMNGGTPDNIERHVQFKFLKRWLTERESLQLGLVENEDLPANS